MIYHIDDVDNWQPLLQTWRGWGEKIATTNGTFDIVHIGHIRLLREAKACADRLIVGLNSDRSVKQYKSEKRPIVPQDERAELVAAIRFVDMVLIFDEPESLRFVREVVPDIHVKDDSYGEDLIERPVVSSSGGKIHLINKDNHSTTNIIQKIVEVYGEKPE
ncbi:MAG: adenylyltransferase/cytidyltransferase family protein [bacterium]|jgi:rfaE bifunctional protein nucleotidyltransferase chain/domain